MFEWMFEIPVQIENSDCKFRFGFRFKSGLILQDRIHISDKVQELQISNFKSQNFKFQISNFQISNFEFQISNFQISNCLKVSNLNLNKQFES